MIKIIPYKRKEVIVFSIHVEKPTFHALQEPKIESHDMIN